MATKQKLRDQGRLARFVTAKAEPAITVGLPASHPAVKEGRTLFPTRVMDADEVPRLLVSGHNNAKIGKRIEKGAWKGFDVYTLTLEERKTCPRSCDVWSECYGNSLHLSRRVDHTHGSFLPRLTSELIQLNRTSRHGFVVRLHVLGDFFSGAYVRFWAQALETFPKLHVYGYTHRRPDADDTQSRNIAKLLLSLSYNHWDRFAIRISSDTPGPWRTIVVDEPVMAPDVIMCPAQTGQTETCGTCGLCWSPAAQDKTIAFLRHGIKRKSKTKSQTRPGASIARLNVRTEQRPLPLPAVQRERQPLDFAPPPARPLTKEIVKRVPYIAGHTCYWPFGGGCERTAEARKPYCAMHDRVAHQKSASK